MAWLELISHPAHPSEAPRRVQANASRSPGGTIALAYRLEADLGRIELPPALGPTRADGLWRHTCFEAFVSGDDEAYCELNFAPSGQWAAYRFARYREGMAPLSELPAPRIDVRRGKGVLELEASVPLSGLPGLAVGARLRLALSAVVEDVEGRLSYWALAHPSDRPDFHHPEGFALELPAGEAGR